MMVKKCVYERGMWFTMMKKVKITECIGHLDLVFFLKILSMVVSGRDLDYFSFSLFHLHIILAISVVSMDTFVL